MKVLEMKSTLFKTKQKIVCLGKKCKAISRISHLEPKPTVMEQQIQFQPSQFSSPLRHVAYMYIQNEYSNISPFKTSCVKGAASLPGGRNKTKKKRNIIWTCTAHAAVCGMK